MAKIAIGTMGINMNIFLLFLQRVPQLMYFCCYFVRVVAGMRGKNIAILIKTLASSKEN